MANSPLLTCPFCNYEDTDADILLQHVNLIHPENEDAPYLVRYGHEQSQQVQPMEGAPDWVECTCGEFCLLTELQDHLDLHGTEETEIDNIDTLTEVVAPSTMEVGHTSSPSPQPPGLESLQDRFCISGRSCSSKSLITHSATHASTNYSEDLSNIKHLKRPSSVVSTRWTAFTKKPGRLGVSSISPLTCKCLT